MSHATFLGCGAWYRPAKYWTATGFFPISWLGISWSKGEKTLFPAKYWHGIRMKIEQNGGKL
jgi:hypothetical protein